MHKVINYRAKRAGWLFWFEYSVVHKNCVWLWLVGLRFGCLSVLKSWKLLRNSIYFLCLLQIFWRRRFHMFGEDDNCISTFRATECVDVSLLYVLGKRKVDLLSVTCRCRHAALFLQSCEHLGTTRRDLARRTCRLICTQTTVTTCKLRLKNFGKSQDSQQFIHTLVTLCDFLSLRVYLKALRLSSD